MVIHLKEERHRLILSAIEADGRVTVAELSRKLDVSEVTVRRDLQDLASRGLLQRSHGGAVLPQLASPEPPVFQRVTETQMHKAQIGRAAAELIPDGSSVFIGSGTTTAQVARHLAGRKNLTVITNALNVAFELATADGVTVVMTGGVMRKSELSLIGHLAELALREVRVDRAVVGMQALSLENGMTNDHWPEVMTDRAVIQMAPELIVVVDHTKFGQVASALIAPIERISTLVTDSETDATVLDRLRRQSIRVIVAPVDGIRSNGVDTQ
jgi:DeoR/GlpR family transcriptional regulator of sugar metabolism